MPFYLPAKQHGEPRHQSSHDHHILVILIVALLGSWAVFVQPRTFPPKSNPFSFFVSFLKLVNEADDI
jgi:hypothetical protein